MNRKVFYIAMILILAILPISQQSSTAQQEDNDGLEPPVIEIAPEASNPADQPEPQVEEVNNPEALVNSNFTYQGRLKFDGAPVNGNCDFIWGIFDVATAGTALATDTDTNQAVANGLFTGVVDVPISVFDGRRLYLETQVRCPTGSGSYTTLTPRQELRGVPYALGVRLPFSHTISNSGSPIFAVTNSSTSTSSPSFLGSSAGGDGVRGISTGGDSADNGVYGESNSPAGSEAGVKGVSTNASSFGGYFNNTATTTSGGALYANGDAKQSLAGDGFVKAAVYVNDCGTSPTITRYFNNVNTTAITVTSGGSGGICTVDFGFDVTGRYIMAISRSSTPRFITFLNAAASDQVTFYKFDENGNTITGDILVLVY